MNKKLIFLLGLIPAMLWGQKIEKEALKTLSDFGAFRSNGFPTYFASPLAPQTYIGYNNIQPNQLMPFEGMVPFGIGARKKLYKKSKHELFISSVVHGQLGHREEDNQYLKGTRVSLLNADFFLNFGYIYQINTFTWIKLETFHRSSHLGDDLVLLNGVTSTNYWGTDESSYEELNLLFNRSILLGAIDLYASAGYNYRDGSPREKWTVTGGFQLDSKVIPVLKRIVFGWEGRWLENNDWKTVSNTVVGLKLNKKGDIKFLASYYTGNVSFSRYESQLKQSYWRFGIYFDSILK